MSYLAGGKGCEFACSCWFCYNLPTEVFLKSSSQGTSTMILRAFHRQFEWKEWIVITDNHLSIHRSAGWGSVPEAMLTLFLAISGGLSWNDAWLDPTFAVDKSDDLVFECFFLRIYVYRWHAMGWSWYHFWLILFDEHFWRAFRYSSNSFDRNRDLTSLLRHLSI